MTAMIPILMYHQIALPAPKGTPFRALTVHPKDFQRQMTWLKRLGYTGLSMRDLMPYLNGEKTGKVVGITFDDGYQNVLQNAIPILNQLGFSSTNYIVSNQFSGSNYWDQDKGVPASRLMSLQELQQWVKSGHEIGSHTLDHVHLDQLDNQSAQQQIQQSKHDLESSLQVEVSAFCYPYGSKNPQIADWVRQSGYINATTTDRGLALASDDLMNLPRVTVARSTNIVRFLQKCMTQLEHKKRTAA